METVSGKLFVAQLVSSPLLGCNLLNKSGCVAVWEDCKKQVVCWQPWPGNARQIKLFGHNVRSQYSDDASACLRRRQLSDAVGTRGQLESHFGTRCRRVERA